MSYVIRERATGKAILESFDMARIDEVRSALRPEYEIVPILKYLQELNREAVAPHKA